MNNKLIVAGIGELLWDVLPSGKHVGGAPCNFSFHAMQAGCESVLISAVGNDMLGDELMEALTDLKINSQYIQRNDFTTGTVDVTVDKKGQPQYIIHENVAWDNTLFNSKINSKIVDFDAVCFGSLGQRNHVSEATIQLLLESVKKSCLKVFDINLRQNFYSYEIIKKSLEFADVLKLNDEELPVLSDFWGLQGEAKVQLNQILKMFDLKYIVYTLGEKGSLILTESESSFLKSPVVEVTDTVGAGDSFTAVFVAGLLKNIPLIEIHKMATQTAAFVCTQKGATPTVPFKIF